MKINNNYNLINLKFVYNIHKNKQFVKFLNIYLFLKILNINSNN